MEHKWTLESTEPPEGGFQSFDEEKFWATCSCGWRSSDQLFAEYCENEVADHLRANGIDPGDDLGGWEPLPLPKDTEDRIIEAASRDDVQGIETAFRHFRQGKARDN